MDDQEKYALVTKVLHRIEYDNIYGYLAGGMAAWITHGMPIDSLSPISAHDLKQQMEENDFGHLLDVCTIEEREQGYIPNTKDVPMTEILDNRLNLPKDEEIILVCRSGYRANIKEIVLWKRQK